MSAIHTASYFARRAIATGADPQGLVHIQDYPADYDGAEPGEVLGISAPLPAGSDLGGCTERYYTLAELAA